MFVVKHKCRYTQDQILFSAVKHVHENLIHSQIVGCYLGSHLSHSYFPVDVSVCKKCLGWELKTSSHVLQS